MSSDQPVRERVAELCHDQWSGWMKYLFSKCDTRPNGDVIMPKWAVERWTRQLSTQYSKLPDSEKETDRAEADKFIELFEKADFDVTTDSLKGE